MINGRELRLPDQLTHAGPPPELTTPQAYTKKLIEDMQEAHTLLRERQRNIRSEDDDEPLLFAVGILVWLENLRRKKGENPKLQGKNVGPYEVLKAYPNHIYKITGLGQISVQSEVRLRLFKPSLFKPFTKHLIVQSKRSIHTCHLTY